MPSGAIIQAQITGTATCVTAAGTLDAVAEICEQLAWIGAAVRSSPDEQGPAKCSPYIRDLRDASPVDDRNVVKCHIEFTVERPSEEEMATMNGRCWYSLFRNPVVVHGFPIQARLESDTGLEMPLNMMAGLAGARRITKFGGQVFLKSFSIILLLAKRMTDTFVWHVLLNDNGSHISYTDPRVWAIAEQWPQDVEMHSIQSARHVVGWCSKVSSLAGEIPPSYPAVRALIYAQDRPTPTMRWLGLNYRKHNQDLPLKRS